MAREESDREDFLREATALVERAELSVEGGQEPFVIGFRRDGAASVMFGAEPVYQFNSRNELRRAYAAGRMFRADAGRLAALDRRREADQVTLVRHDLDDAETRQFLAEMESRLRTLREALNAGRFQLNGQVPPDRDVVGRIRQWLESLGDSIPIARSPRVQ